MIESWIDIFRKMSDVDRKLFYKEMEQYMKKSTQELAFEKRMELLEWALYYNLTEEEYDAECKRQGC